MYVVISTHAVYNKLGDVHGPPHTVSDYLFRKRIRHIFICFDLAGGVKAIVYTLTNHAKNKQVFSKQKYLPRFLFELVLLNSFIPKREKVLFIGVNPINALYGWVYKIFGRVDKLIFYSADFAYQRFNNKLLSWLYCQLNYFCIKRADSVWSVSKRIQKVWKEHGLPDKQNIHIPNAPLIPKKFKLSIKRRKATDLVIVSHLTTGVDFDSLFIAIEQLIPKFSELRLEIIGTGEKEKKLKRKVKKINIEGQIFFLGPKSHKEVLDILNKSGVGIALYTDKAPWSYFRDSIKLREYLALGLPVITTSSSSLAEKIRLKKAGYVIKPTTEQIKRCLRQLLEDKDKYRYMQKNALKLAKDYDICKILDKIALCENN